ncbi:ankyrin repeat-containing domain protein [Lentinula raphanica]|nr:ankyrin repeat-containing domain protein [Lentinula raphanica]
MTGNTKRDLPADKEKLLREWFAAPDCSVDFNTAMDKRADGTCEWILRVPAYLKWRKGGNILWIQGKAGSGKTILMTSNIDSLKKTSHQGLLWSLLLQLGFQDNKIHPALESLYEISKHGLLNLRPITSQVIDTLMKIIRDLTQKGHWIHIIVDALNECKEMHLVLDLLVEVANFSSVGVMLSSCNHPPKELSCFIISLDNLSLLHEDIIVFLDSQIQIMFKSTTIGAMIKKTFINKTDKGFRYIECQLKLLKAKETLLKIKRLLSDLPKDLKESYAMALEIYKESDYYEDMENLLLWLLYAFEPLHMGQVAAIFSIDLKHSKVQSEMQAFFELEKIVDPILVTMNNANMVQLAHASVQEYLLENYNTSQITKLPNLNAQLGHSIIAQMCLTFLIQQDNYDALDDAESSDSKNRIMFDQYATQYWAAHAQYDGTTSMPYENTVKLVEAFLQEDSRHFTKWQSSYTYNGRRMPEQGQIFSDCNPLQIVAFFGLKEIAQRLLTNNIKTGAYIQNNRLSDIDSVGHAIGTATQAAASGGYKETVQILLEHKADVNALGGFYGTALQAAASGGYKETIELLLRYNANVDAQGGYYGTALQAAASGGHKETIQLLFKYNAKVNTQGGYYGTALQAAASGGYNEVIQLLLKHHAGIDIQAGYYGTALEAAAFGGFKDTVQLLLKYNANANTLGGQFGTALEAAAFSGHKEILEMLLEQNVNINAQGGYYGTALQAAVVKGHKHIIKLLLELHADVNVQGGYYGTALQAAAFLGYREIIEVLLKHNADVNIQRGEYGTALQAAAFEGHIDIVVLLLHHGANVNTQGGYHGTALQAAIFNKHNDVVEVLLEHDANDSSLKY